MYIYAIILLFVTQILCVTCSSNSKFAFVTRIDVEDKLKEHDKILFEFTAPWCGKCEQLSDSLEILQYKLASKGFKWFKIDSSLQNELNARFEISVIPSFYVYDNGQVWKYEGPMEADRVVQYALNDHLNAQPLSWLYSPVSFVGYMKWYMMHIGYFIISVINLLRDVFGMPTWGIYLLIILFGIVMISGISVLGVWVSLPPHDKSD